MSKFLRKEQILEFIRINNVCSINKLIDEFKMSVSTLHRDLDLLEREGRINKFYGQVTISEEKDLFKSRININIELKERIARKALEFIENNDCIFLDNSTTVYYLAKILCTMNYENILVVSNNGFISNLFLNCKNIDLVLTGGKLNKNLNCYIGQHAIKAIDDFNASSFFFSSSCISVEGEVSDIFFPDVLDVKIKMFNKSRRTFLLIDSTKFSKISSSKYLELKNIDYIITDNKISEEEVDKFKKIGVDLIIA